MYTNFDTYSMTDLRHNLVEILAGLSSKSVVYLVRNSKPEAAMVDLEYLKALQSAHEDYLDTLEFDKTINLKRVSLAKHKKFR